MLERPTTKRAQPAATPNSGWTFISNHGHVLLCLAAEPEMLLREVAIRVGITERAVQRIVAELEEAGYLTRERRGRRNRYEFHPACHLRHAVEGHRTIGELIDFVIGPHTAAGFPSSGRTRATASGIRLKASNAAPSRATKSTLRRSLSAAAQ